MARLNWHPTVEQKVQRYELQQQAIAREQRMKQLESEIAQLDELNSKIDALLCSSNINSTPSQNTPGNSEA